MHPADSLLTCNTLTQISASLQASGRVWCRLEDLQVDVAEWRSLARRAGRQLGRSVQTVVGHDQVSARLLDWPANEDERAVNAAILRATIQQAAASLPVGASGGSSECL